MRAVFVKSLRLYPGFMDFFVVFLRCKTIFDDNGCKYVERELKKSKVINSHRGI